MEEVGPLVVRFVDYGNFDVIDDDEIFQLPENLCRIPLQSVHCKIRGIEQLVDNDSFVEMSGDNRRLFKSVITVGQLVAVFHMNETSAIPPYEVDLSSNLNIANFIIANNLVDFRLNEMPYLIEYSVPPLKNIMK